MKKSDLLKLLADVGDDEEILVDGYEAGFDEPSVRYAIVRPLAPGEYRCEYSGQYKGDYYERVAGVEYRNETVDANDTRFFAVVISS